MLTHNRICNEAPVKGGGNEGLSLAEQGVNVQRWSVLWRTMILSALGKTMFPYCRHLRMLDLRDLSELLADDKFRGKTVKTFFDGDMAQFHFMLPAVGKRAARLTLERLFVPLAMSSFRKRLFSKVFGSRQRPKYSSMPCQTGLPAWHTCGDSRCGTAKRSPKRPPAHSYTRTART